MLQSRSLLCGNKLKAFHTPMEALKGGKTLTLKENFKRAPSMYYAMSIAATWAGVNSLMGGIEVAHQYGIVPYLLWALGNILACILFGVLAPKIPKLRDVFKSRPMKIIAGLLCVFQVWISLNGIQGVFSETVLGSVFGQVIAYTVAALYIIILWKRGMIGNVLTDHASWVAVYALIAVLTAVAFASNGAYTLSLGLSGDNIAVGMEKCLLLLPGPFLYPYFFEILDYNDDNSDGTRKTNIKRAFIGGGVLFGVYLLFAFALAFTSFGPITGIVKAVLITLIAVSSLSSFLYSIYIAFGKKLGIGINIAAVAAWQFLIPLGVMGVWTVMSTIRIYIVGVVITVAFVWHFRSKSKIVSNAKGGAAQ